jgi:murein DD-endopeptidase MepM/ murein hydrolase activator NlpD
MESAEINGLLVSLSAWYLPAIYIATTLASTRLAMPQARAEWMRNGFVLIVIQVVFLALHSPRAAGCVTILMAVSALWFLVRSAQRRKRLQRGWERCFEGKNEQGPVLPPLTLHPPFAGIWRALSGGGDAAKNHHFAARPQWFGYDLVRIDAPTLGSEIFSPVDGVVVGTENACPDKPASRFLKRREKRQPAGNFVLIKVTGREDIYVLLAHLQQGSVAVAIGDHIQAAQVVGRCGNSGNTTRPHLHVHAQFVAKEKLNAKGVSEPMQWAAWGVPILLAQNGGARRIQLGEPLWGQKPKANA